MSRPSDTRNASSVQVVVYHPDAAARAYRLHAALVRAHVADPELLNDPLFNRFRREALQRFNDAFGVS